MKSHVVVHHSATKDSGSVSVSAIRRYHVETNGWLDIGYHFLVEEVNGHYEWIAGRAIDESGAHCYQQGMNRKGLGVCFIGNYDDAPPPLAMMQFAARHLQPLLELLGIPLDREHIHPHNEFATYKSCPGKSFPLDRFITLLEGA